MFVCVSSDIGTYIVVCGIIMCTRLVGTKSVCVCVCVCVFLSVGVCVFVCVCVCCVGVRELPFLFVSDYPCVSWS